IANLLRRLPEDRRRLADRLGAISAADHDRVELTIHDGRYRGARNHAGGRYPDHDFGVICAHDLERERAGELTEELPVYLQHALRGVDLRLTWRHLDPEGGVSRAPGAQRGVPRKGTLGALWSKADASGILLPAVRSGYTGRSRSGKP